MQVIGSLLITVLWIFLVFLFVRLVVDWVQFFARGWEPRGVLLVALEGVYTVTDPPLKALRRVIPPLRLGGFALDLSFLLLIVIVYVLVSLVGYLFGVA
ncbi:YggT family protein [Actinopolymorpha alba]|uniref:YggT family protein n=1 Tax=Actinopolymorpha alba TaxID=533267 RepID=UPI000382C199|nr:YggT family protein [Actinopolymorpha alba]